LMQMYATAKMEGKDELASNVLDFLSSHYKSAGQVAQSQFQAGLAKDYSQIASTNQVENDRVRAEMLGYYTRAIGELKEPYQAILKDPGKYTTEQLVQAQTQLSNLQNSL